MSDAADADRRDGEPEPRGGLPGAPPSAVQGEWVRDRSVVRVPVNWELWELPDAAPTAAPASWDVARKAWLRDRDAAVQSGAPRAVRPAAGIASALPVRTGPMPDAAEHRAGAIRAGAVRSVDAASPVSGRRGPDAAYPVRTTGMEHAVRREPVRVSESRTAAASRQAPWAGQARSLRRAASAAAAPVMEPDYWKQPAARAAHSAGRLDPALRSADESAGLPKGAGSASTGRRGLRPALPVRLPLRVQRQREQAPVLPSELVPWKLPAPRVRRMFRRRSTRARCSRSASPAHRSRRAGAA